MNSIDSGIMARFTKNSDREYDVVLLGATGFTGRFAAMHLAEIDRDLKWAIAGRSGAKLTKLAEELRLKTSQNPGENRRFAKLILLG